ncbi:MAG: hypothetical protein ACM3PY_08170 [Omnitrophica WOR_2 bacterium]
MNWGLIETLQNWESEYQKEIDHALESRQAGNEGKARVCARRAAGIIAAEYLKRRGIPATGYNAYELLQILQNIPDLPPDVKEIASHFLLRLKPDHTFPIHSDLVGEARWLAAQLVEIKL